LSLEALILHLARRWKFENHAAINN
jgi:hypothetical protein